MRAMGIGQALCRLPKVGTLNTGMRKVQVEKTKWEVVEPDVSIAAEQHEENGKKRSGGRQNKVQTYQWISLSHTLILTSSFAPRPRLGLRLMARRTSAIRTVMRTAKQAILTKWKVSEQDQPPS